MRYDTPQLFVWDKRGKEVRIGDRVEWMTDSWYKGGRKRRAVQGTVYAIVQKSVSPRKADSSPAITKLKVMADDKSYSDYSYGTTPVTLTNFGNIFRLNY